MTTVPERPSTRISSGCGPRGSAIASPGSCPLRWLPETSLVAPLSAVKSSSSQIELQTW
jgi:hypothetical protein